MGPAINSASMAPTEVASVGVAMPPGIAPNTAKISSTGGTMAVEAASKAPTSTTEMPGPPRSWPKLRPMVSSSSSAILLSSRMAPIRTKTGIAIGTVLVMRPKAR